MKVPFSQFNSKDKSFNVIEGVLVRKEFDKKIDQNLVRKGSIPNVNQVNHGN